MLVLNDLTYRIGRRVLLDDATATVPAGARVGLVGRNGTGKTTLFRIIAGEITPEHGQMQIPPRDRIGRLAQEAPDGPESLLEVVLKAEPNAPAAGRGGNGARAAPDRRDPDPARRYRRTFGARARCRDPRRPRLFPRRPATPVRRILRRMAHAGCARGNAVRRA